ncbi:MAG: LamG domain-containing protein [Pirellulales bacterium]|nr:LamG domain-containing protein [Pirellulales bacterium]
MLERFAATCWLLALLNSPVVAAEPVAHWPLTIDARDAGSQGVHSVAHEVQFTTAGASFDGRSSRIEASDSDVLQFGSGDFTVSAYVEIPAALDDVVGDVVSKFDSQKRRGFQLSIVTNAAAASGTSNRCQVQFGIDDDYRDANWRDEGRPGNSVLIFALATHAGRLYAGTCEPGADQAGHVYRYDAPGRWHDLGSPDRANSVAALAEFNGQLFAATARYRLRGSALTDSPNDTLGGSVYRFDDDTQKWIDCGRLTTSANDVTIEAINGLVVYRNKLYASSTYSPGFFRYEGGTSWTSLGTANNRRVEALTVFNGAIFAGSYDAAEIHRYEPDGGWQVVGSLLDNTQTYGFGVYGGSLYVGTWPTGCVYRYDGPNQWFNSGRLGEEREVMPLVVYNGSFYAGTLPLANIYRFDNNFDGDSQWRLVGRVDHTPDVTYRRVWSLAVHDGRLFAGTLPSGHVWSWQAGCSVTHDHELAPGWHHLAGVRSGDELLLYVDGREVARAKLPPGNDFNLDNDRPLLLGAGPHDHLRGRTKDVRLYRAALSAKEIETLSSAK